MSSLVIKKDALTEHFSAAIAMLENIVKNCNNDLWNDSSKDIVIGQVVYHVCYFIEEHLCKTVAEAELFKPGFGKTEMGEYINGQGWDGTFSQADTEEYLSYLRKKVKKRIDEISEEELISEPVFEWHGSSFLSSFMYSLRHIMLHIGALHVRINPTLIKPLKWVTTGRL